MSSQQRSVICLMGPTASGKTQLSLSIARHLPVEIISVDSAMIYREMNIGTAKPEQDILKKIPHHLIDILDPAESYSAAQFCKDATVKIEAIIARGKIPLLVGGTMLYFRALQQGLSTLPSAISDIRLALQEQADEVGWPGLHEVLQKIDPDAAKRIHPNDSQRIQRALEIYESTGKTITEWQQENRGEPTKYHMINVIVSPSDRAVLHQRIQQRFDAMLQMGFIDEVKQLFQRSDLSIEKPSMRSVGYRQVWEYLAGSISYEEMRERAIAATRQLAKRQLTWLRSWKDAVWFDAEKDIASEVMLYLNGKLQAYL